MRSPRNLDLLAVFVILGGAGAACGGNIVFGHDKGDAGFTQFAPDATEIMGGVDASPTFSPDADMMMMQMDAGGGGNPCPTTFPTMWPFANTTVGYKTHFWTAVGTTCSLGTVCHGQGSIHQPLIPEDANITANLTQAISDLMVKVQPGGAAARLTSHHRMGSADTPNSFTFPANIQTSLDSFVAELQSCSGCMNGACACTGAGPTCMQ